MVRELVRPEGFLGGLGFAPGDKRPFIGRAKGDQFNFRRRTGWHNSFQPLVVGHVRSIPHGAVFEALIRLHLGVAVLVPVLFGTVAVLAIQGSDYSLLLFLTLFGGAGLVSYRYECRKAERILRDAFESTGGLFPGPLNG